MPLITRLEKTPSTADSGSSRAVRNDGWGDLLTPQGFERLLTTN